HGLVTGAIQKEVHEGAVRTNTHIKLSRRRGILSLEVKGLTHEATRRCPHYRVRIRRPPCSQGAESHSLAFLLSRCGFRTLYSGSGGWNTSAKNTQQPVQISNLVSLEARIKSIAA